MTQAPAEELQVVTPMSEIRRQHEDWQDATARRRLAAFGASGRQEAAGYLLALYERGFVSAAGVELICPDA